MKPEFIENVYAVARAIPKGRVTSYGAIARVVGTGQSARMVGWAMNKSGRAMPPVPAHRVVNRRGELTGRHHFPEEGMMEQLLRDEGISVVDGVIANFDEVFWDPMKEFS